MCKAGDIWLSGKKPLNTPGCPVRGRVACHVPFAMRYIAETGAG
jgi:hypothetical protein